MATLKRRKPTSPKAPPAVAKKKAAQGLARRKGYREAYSAFNDRLTDWGLPEALLPIVRTVGESAEFTIAPSDAKASESYLNRFSQSTAPLRAMAMVRGMVGYPTEAPDGSIFLKPDAKIVQIADERAHGKPKQPIAHSIDEATRELLEGLMTRPRALNVIEARAELVEEA